MNIGDVRLDVVFYRTGAGTEPVRRWLKSLPVTHRKAIGEDMKTVQFGWPLGMPLVEKLGPYLWEVSLNSTIFDRQERQGHQENQGKAVFLGT